MSRQKRGDSSREIFLVLGLFLFIIGFFFLLENNSFFLNSITGYTILEVNSSYMGGKDTYINNGTGGGGELFYERNFGGANTFQVGNDCPVGNCAIDYGLIWWNLTDIPSNASIDDVMVSIFCESKVGPTATVNFTIHPLLHYWEEGTGSDVINSDSVNGSTWQEAYFGNNLDDGGAEDWQANGTGIDGVEAESLATSEHQSNGVAVWYNFNETKLKSYIQGWVNGSYENYGILIERTNSIIELEIEGVCQFTSNEGTNASNHPKILIDYTEIAPADIIFPGWTETAQNTTSTPSYGDIVSFNVTVTDETALSSVWFATDDSGTWTNQTPLDISGTTNQTSTTYVLTNNTGDAAINWVFYFNDTSGNENVTDTQSLTINPDSDSDLVTNADDVCPNTLSDWSNNVTSGGCAQGPDSNDTFILQPNAIKGKETYIRNGSAFGDELTVFGEMNLIEVGYDDAPNDENVHRGMIHFNLSYIPETVNILNTTISLWIDNAIIPPSPDLFDNYTLHKINQDWSEGDCDDPNGCTNSEIVNGSTWIERFYGNNLDDNDAEDWQANGTGTDAADNPILAISDTVNLSAYPFEINFSDSELNSQVKSWINGSTTNYGFLIISSAEFDGTTTLSMVQITSSEGTTEIERPKITITYSISPSADIIFPGWTETAQNTTSTPSYGDIVSFNVTVTDETALSSVWFATDDSGTWTNQTPLDISGTTNQTSTTYVLTNNTGDAAINWVFYFNDTSGNENVTDTQSLTINPDSDSDLVTNADDVCPNTLSDWSNNVTSGGCAQGPDSNDTFYLKTSSKTFVKDTLVENGTGGSGEQHQIANFGALSTFDAGNDCPGGSCEVKYGLVYWNISGIPSNAHIYNQADTNISLNCESSLGPSINANFTMHIISKYWEEGTGSGSDGTTNTNAINGTTWVERYFENNLDDNSDSDWQANGTGVDAIENETIAVSNHASTGSNQEFIFQDSRLAGSIEGWINGSYENVGVLIERTNHIYEIATEGGCMFSSSETTDNTKLPIISVYYNTSENIVGGSVGATLSTNLSEGVVWNVISLPQNNLSADGNLDVTLYNITISATATTADLYVRAEGNLTTGSSVIEHTNQVVSYNSTNSSVPTDNKYPLTLNYADTPIGTNLEDSTIVYLKFFLSVPASQSPGTYFANISFKVIPNGQGP